MGLARLLSQHGPKLCPAGTGITPPPLECQAWCGFPPNNDPSPKQNDDEEPGNLPPKCGSDHRGASRVG